MKSRERKVIGLENSNMFFISHSSKDSAYATELYNLLLEIDPSWKGRIFLDCCEERPLESHEEWRSRMLKELERTRHLIFITSSLEHVKEGNGWLYEEVSLFQDLKANRNRQNRGEYNLSYFGIFLCQCDFENALFKDSLRGSEYRRMFQRPEHLVLGEGETIAGAAERIKAKVNSLISGENADENATLLLDKVRAFALQKAKNDVMFSKAAIDEGLIPLVRGSENSLSFPMLCELVQKEHVALLGSEGGSGKTTILTKLFYHHLDNADITDPCSMIPLYVDAKSLVAENHLLLRHLAKVLFDEHTAMTDRATSSSVGLLDYEFSKKRAFPRYLLIIDGYNEIPDGSVAQIDRELLAFLPNGRYTNVRVVIAGRHVSSNLPESVFEQITVQPLAGIAVSGYLKEKGLWTGKIKESLFRILSIPMYLKMYAETSAEARIQNKADLLCAFVDWQQEKDLCSAATEEKKALYQVFLRHVLPALAHGMLMKNSTDSSFILTLDELEKLLIGVSERLCETSYKKFYGREYRDWLRDCKFADYDELDLSDLTVEYFVRTCKMLRQNSEGDLDFTHQIYRDFFCAWYISEDVKRSVEKGESCQSLSQKPLDRDIIEFITELLREKKTIFHKESGVWEYSCNDDSKVLPLLDIIRHKENTAVCAANILEVLKYARKLDLSGLDLSGLDLTRSTLRTCLFYRHDAAGQHPTTFAGSKINRQNLFTENHFEEIIAACTNEHYVACVDVTGVLNLWERKRVVQFPVKIITNVRYAIQKLLFGPENDRIYAMTDHEILEIPIPEAFFSKAQPRILFETPKRLRDMALDENGKLLFTTNLNSFNFKSVDAPDAPDRHKFYGINSGACMSASGDWLAFGHIAGYEGLKIYQHNAQSDSWQELRFGYSAVLNDFILELETLFQDLRLYHKFPTDNEGYDKRRTYFSYIQQQFEDCTHDHDRIPGLIVKRCRERLELKGEQPIKLFPAQVKKLDQLVEKYAQILKNLLESNNLLMFLPGRTITGVSFRKDSHTLLVSCAMDFAEKLRRRVPKNMQYDTIVLEINTDTFETRFITRFTGDDMLRASYCGDDILVLSKYHLTVYDTNGSDIAHVTTCPKIMRHFISPPGKNTFFAISPHFIYEMDQDMRCHRSMNNSLEAVKLSYGVDDQGREYLMRKSPAECALPGEPIQALDLSNGTGCQVCVDALTTTTVSGSGGFGNMRFKVCAGRLVSFKNEIKLDEMDVPYKLFVCGCDFRGVQGSVTDPRYMEMLYRMGAVTDTVVLPEVTVEVSHEGFVPSAAPLVLPENVEQWHVPYELSPGLTLEEDCHFSDAVGGNQLYIQKTWSLINKGSYSTNDLEEADYAILEWISRFDFAHSGMITDLLEAGIIEKPTRFQDAGKRLAGALHRTFKFVFRSRFCINGEPKKTPIYTVCFPYGAKLLQHITGTKLKNPLYIPHNPNTARVKTPGRKNEYICIDGAVKLKEIRRTLALGRWFTLTASRYKALLRDHSLNTVFDTDAHFSGRGNIHGYIQLGEQAFFAQAFRSLSGNDLDQDIPDKVNRMCILALYYRTLTRYGQQLHKLERQPVIVLIGEDLNQCRLLNARVASMYPNVRKLFTFDALFTSKEAFEGTGCYFEFVDGIPHSVRLDDLLS